MRRYTFYLSVALLAFGIGSFVVFSFYWNNALEAAVQIEAPQDFAAAFASNKLSLHLETGIESLISDKDEALLLFEPTLKKWLEKERIAELIEPSPEILERIMRTKLHRYQAPHLTRTARKSYKPALLDLNDDGLTELSILVDYGETRDGELWMFRNTGRDFEVILRTSEELEKFEITKKKSKGFSNVQTSFYPNEAESEVLISFDDYKFDGREYKLSGCSIYINRYRDKRGELRRLRKPIVRHLDSCC